MNITEKDIFNFVFSPNELDKEKILYIEKNMLHFKDKIELAKSSLEAFESEELYNLPKEISDSLAENEYTNKIKLEKVVQKENNSNGFVRLAADSPKFEKKISVDTFIDNKQEYIVKVISQEDATNIYVFKNDNSPIENFSLKLLPSHKVLHYQNNSNPIKIEHQSSIENVELRI